MAKEVTLYPICDGDVEHDAGVAGPFLTWAELIAAAGTHAYEEENSAWAYFYNGNAGSNKWRGLYRGILNFDLSAYSDIKILTAKMKVYGMSAFDPDGHLPATNLYGAITASATALTPSDYAGVLGTPFSIVLPFASWDDDGWNQFAFNDSGLAYLNGKIGLKPALSIRNSNYDVASVTPSWEVTTAAGVGWRPTYYGENTKPQLILTYIGLSPRRTVAIEDKITLEMIRNVEMAAHGSFYVDKEGKAIYHSRFARKD